jgi:hypothetical protein
MRIVIRRARKSFCDRFSSIRDEETDGEEVTTFRLETRFVVFRFFDLAAICKPVLHYEFCSVKG